MVSSLTVKTKASNTVKMGIWSLLCVMLVVLAIVLLAASGSMVENPHLFEVAIEHMTKLGTAMATLGSVATGAKGARDAVGSYSDAVKVKTEVSYRPPVEDMPDSDEEYS